MKNCNVKKFKATINDDNLEKFGVLKIHINEGTYGQYGDLRLAFNEVGNSVKSYGGYIAISAAGLANEDNEITPQSTGEFSVYTSNAAFDIEIKSKYALTVLLQYTTKSVINTADLMYLTSLTALRIRQSVVEPLSNLSKLVNLSNLNVNGSFIKGTLDDISTLTALTELDLSYTGTRISGDLETFAKKQFIGRNRQAGSITLNTTGNSVITFNGVNAAAVSTLSWKLHSGDSSKLDVTFNGTTVVVNL